MGNSNASFRGSLRKQNSVGVDNCNIDDFQIREVPGAIVVDKKTDSNQNKKSKILTTDIKASSRKTKDQVKQIEDLENQLKERTERIKQLESDLKNNNNNSNEEKHLNAQLQIDLDKQNATNLKLSSDLKIKESYIYKNNNAFEALTVVLQGYLAQVDNQTEKLSHHDRINEDNKDLRNHNSSLETELNNIKKLLESESSRNVAYQDDIKSIAEKHKYQVNELDGQHENKINEINLIYKKEIESIKRQYENDLNNLRQAKDTYIESIQSELEEQVKKSKEELDNLKTKLNDEATNNLKDKEEQHENKVKRLQNEYEGKVNDLQITIDTLSNEKNVLEQQLTTKQQIPNGEIKNTATSARNLSAELESLQAVLEMKNEEVKNLRVKQMELERKLDGYYELQTKFDITSQQNQSLTEALKNKSKLERRISVERDTYMERLEKEAKKVSRLSMEKEQLMWRASNPDLSYSSPNIFFEDDETDDPPSPLRSSGSFSSTPKKNNMDKNFKRRSMNFPISKSEYSLS